jgi:hypothetical protein
MKVHDYADEIRTNGLVTLPGVYSKKQCLEFKEKADAVIDSFILRQSTLIHPNCQYIINPFRHDADLMALVINEQTDQILKILID